MIASRLHKLAENVDPNTGQFGSENETVALMMQSASYVLDPAVFDLLKRVNVNETLKAMIEGDCVHLPHPQCVFEFEVDPGAHEFVLLKTIATGVFSCRYAMIDTKTSNAMAFDQEYAVLVSESGYSFVFSKSRELPGSPDREIPQLIANITSFALTTALVLTNLRGIERKVVTCEKLNKARTKSGKPPVANHTILRIGTVYRSDGTACQAGEKGTKIPHVRQGYTRRQHYGKGNAETKLIYIPPCLVNFDPASGEEAPVSRKIVTM